jgi:hypothetical protein
VARRPSLLLAALVAVALVAAACGGGGAQAARPKTVEDLSAWIKDGGECEEAETNVTRLPVPKGQEEDVAPALLQFDKQANYGAIVSCGGLNGYILYFRFASAQAREAAVSGRDGLIAHELFCAKGSEMVINNLLGYDSTIGFCERLGFPIHQPTHGETPAIERRHEALEKATTISAHANHLPYADIFCMALRNRPLEFECEPFTGGIRELVKLAEKEGRFVLLETITKPGRTG